MLDKLILSEVPFRLAQALVRRKIAAGSFLFVGPRGVGKGSFAKELARALHKGEGPDPDLLVLEGRESIKIEEIRELNYFLGLKAAKYTPKIALLLGAERLTTEAANALLKTLEEPKNALLILTTNSPELLLPTIVSRCLLVRFGLVEREKIQARLAQEGTRPEERNKISLLASGQVGKALTLARDENALQESQAQVEEVLDFLRRSLLERLAFLERGFKGAELTDKLRAWLEAVLLLIDWKTSGVRDYWLGEKLDAITLEELLNFASWLDEALFSLGRRQNANLVLGEMILQMPNGKGKQELVD